MFQLFKKKEPSTKVIDRIWMYEAFKRKAFAAEWKKNNAIVFIFWFDETMRAVENEWPGEPGEILPFLTAREVSAATLSGKQPVMAEHYPLSEKENELFQKLGLKEVQVWSALDEPLFQQFGSDKIVHLMKQLGMKEDAVIEHAMITKAIRNAQDKIRDKLTLEQGARSQKEWMERNVTK